MARSLHGLACRADGNSDTGRRTRKSPALRAGLSWDGAEDLVLDHLELDTAILFLAFRRAVVGDRLGFAEPDRPQAIALHAAPRKIFLHRVRAALGQAEV